MRYLLSSLLTVIALIGPGLSWSAQTSLNDLIVLGLRANTQLQIEQLEVEKAKQEIVIEESVFDPHAFSIVGYEQRKSPFVSDSFSGRISTREYQGTVGLRKNFTTGLTASASLTTERFSGYSTTSALNPRYRSAFVLELTQPLLRNFGRTVNNAALDRAGYQLEQAELGYLLAAQHLAVGLEYGLRELALHNQIVELRKDSLKLAEDLLYYNRLRFDEGVVPVTEIQEARSAQAARRLLLAQARQDRDRLFVELNRQLNGQLPLYFDPTDIFFSEIHKPTSGDNFSALLDTARAKRLDLQISQLSLAVQQRQLDFLRHQLKPQLDLRLQAGLNGLAGRQDNDTSYSGSWTHSFDSMSSADGHHWGVAFEFSFPLGNRQAQSRYRQSQLATQQQRYQITDLDVQLQMEIREALIRFEHAAEQLDIAFDVERLAAISLEQEQRRLDEGLSDTFRLLSFQDNMIKARAERLQAVTAYHLAQARLAFVTGEIFERYNIRLTESGEGSWP